MKLDIRLASLTIVAIACIGGGLYWQLSGESPEGSSSLVYSGVKGDGNSTSARERLRARRVGRVVSKRVDSSREKPNLLDFEDEELRELTDLARKLLASLQAALDAEDFEQIKSIIAMVEKSPKGVLSKSADGLPVFMRKRIIEAVGWFGAKGMPELVDFLGDADSDVVEVAMDQFELALEDITLGDRDRAQIVVMASKALHDDNALERIFMEISNMRNSVAAETIVEICNSGTEEAKARMPEIIEFVTGEDNIYTVEGIEKWLAENPDGEYDDDLYGPMDLGDN